MLDFKIAQQVKANTDFCHILGVQAKDKKVLHKNWPKEIQNIAQKYPILKEFKGEEGEIYTVFDKEQNPIIIMGLGEKIKKEQLKRNIATAFKNFEGQKVDSALIYLDTFAAEEIKKVDEMAELFVEAFALTDYKFNLYKSKQTKEKKKTIVLNSSQKIATASIKAAQQTAECINLSRDLSNKAPNELDSVSYAKLLEQDAKKLKNVKIKILKKSEIVKEKMGLLLSVNAGSSKEPRFVHLTYIPKKKAKNSKHIALVGKGITFDTGGYNLKPSTSIAGMKFDMAGSSTVYGAFRAAVLLESPHTISCIIPLTDNAIGPTATTPDSIIKGRNGKTVEILNTDAEGRLILADALDYTCDLKPNYIIDAATLTGACLVALGTEVCAIMSNNNDLTQKLKESAQNAGEYLWELPIIEEWKKDIKSKVADIKNIGGNRNAGTPKAAAFLQEFIKNDIAWAHLDIAGVADNQSHLPYCPANGASGVMIKSLINFLMK